MFFTSSIIVSAPKSSAQPGERQRQQWWQLSQRSHACFRLSAATVKRDLKGGALRFESTCADDDGAEGRFHQGLSDYCFTTSLLSRAPAQLRRLPLLGSETCSVSHRAGSLGQLSRLPGQRLVARAAARFSSDQHPPELRCARAREPLAAHALTLACTHVHHQLSPSGLPTVSWPT